MKRNLFYATWYTLWLTGVVFAATIVVVMQKTQMIKLAVVSVLAILQIIGLAYYLHRPPNRQEPLLLKCLLRLLQLSAVGVLAFLVVCIYALGNSYHNDLPTIADDTENSNITIAETEDLYILYPKYQTVELKTEHRPDRSDSDITFCSSATFQKRYTLSFSPEEIAGVYVVNGELIRGYKIEGLGSFAYYDGTFHFAGKDDAEDEQRKAAEHGGWGFQGYTLIHEHETLSVPVHKYRCFRALAETDGKLAIIESKKHMYLKDFCESMQKLGVSNAIYLDMGSLSYSWYRDNTGEAKTLIGFPQPFSHNWLVFRK